MLSYTIVPSLELHLLPSYLSVHITQQAWFIRGRHLLFDKCFEKISGGSNSILTDSYLICGFRAGKFVANFQKLFVHYVNTKISVVLS